MKKKIKAGVILLIAFLIISCVYLNYGYNHFNIQENFTSIPLSFNPEDSSSFYNWGGAEIKIKGGFVKGKIIDDNNIENIIVRSLSVVPSVTLRGDPEADKSYYIRLENVNPVNIEIKGAQVDKQEVIDPHTLLIVFNLKGSEERKVDFLPVTSSEYPEFVILGDNRNGYQTFSLIIDQINAINPIFVIDNGDLVFGGEPNKYRLFYETVSKLRVPLYTTLGNHDIRENGLPTYTKLFGPPYYSFDYANNHFVFLDSSRGWAEKTAISEEEYIWLEKDLKKASGKRIFVISHVPPVDPRNNLEKNSFPDEPGTEKYGFFESLLNTYNEYRSKDHGFPDQQEAARFEDIMTKYKVDTVFLSHIHSYFSFIKNDVRYIISGGAGAELLSQDSYYHYLRVEVNNNENYIEMIQLPSPTNTVQDRYIAAASLFASSIWKEYKTMIILFCSLAALSVLLLPFSTRKSWWKVKQFGRWLTDVIGYAIRRYKELR